MRHRRGTGLGAALGMGRDTGRGTALRGVLRGTPTGIPTGILTGTLTGTMTGVRFLAQLVQTWKLVRIICWGIRSDTRLNCVVSVFSAVVICQTIASYTANAAGP